MEDHTPEELREARRPIASLIGKSEKAQQKLSPGTWQHTMLRDNVRALRIASALMEAAEPQDFTPDDLRQAATALSSMIDRTEKSQARFLPGTSQHTLQRNRLKALRIAHSFVDDALDARST